MPHSEHAGHQLEQNRGDFERALKDLESGQLSIGRRYKPNTPAVDDTSPRIAEIKRQIAELDALLWGIRCLGVHMARNAPPT
jgi:hypothetical protein